jgi:phospholipase C
MPTPFKHLVVLMLENRSFDHMLGFLKAPGYAIEGLNGDETNIAADGGPPVGVSRNAQTVGDLNPDPGHDFLNVNIQIFGNSAGTPGGQPMQGFVQDYALVSNDAVQSANIMKCFTLQTLPVLSTLAKQYAICDHWFSSVPSSTIPNRLFVHGANSQGSVMQEAIVAPSRLKTIFEVMDEAGNGSGYRIYTTGASILMANLYLTHNQAGFHPYDEFRNDCLNGDLPAYTFIEPSYDDDPANGLFANSEHPDFPVDAGEALIADVYSAIRDGRQWETTLLLIVYDEHGGLFDHVEPPAVVRDPANVGLPDVPASQDPPFTFDRLGVRVPAVFVSPYIEPGTIIKHQFDHCSIVATVRKLFCQDKNPFNWREAQAATFDDILNRPADNPRTDRVDLPAPFVSAPAVLVTGTGGLPNGVSPGRAGALPNGAPSGAGSPAAGGPGEPPRIRFASAPPKQRPTVRKPTDLMIAMARAMQYSMETMGVQPAMRVSQIYSAQDVNTFFRHATRQLKSKG